MQRFLIWGVSLGSLGSAALLLFLAPESLRNWWGETFQGEMVCWLPHLPVLIFVIAALWGWHLRQTKIPLLALLLISAHALLNLPLLHEAPPEQLREGLAVFLPWAFPLLLSWPERTLKSLSGWARIGAILSIWLGSLIWAWNQGFAAFWPANLSGIPAGVKSISTFLALLTLWVLPFAERPDLRASWTWSLISLGFASLHGEQWWPESVSAAPWPVFLSFSALFLLGGLYGLTWRRAYLDELTGIPGRRAFEDSLRRLGRHYAIAMVDVDHFKQFNDRYGHQVGDQILRFVAAHLKKISFGLLFRYGGEEFALIMPGRRAQKMIPLLEGLRHSIESSKFTIRGKNRPTHRPRRKEKTSGGKEKVGVTVSIGAARKSPFHSTPEAVVKAADEALYRAKQMGRNRVELARSHRESSVKRINCHEWEEENWREDKMRKKRTLVLGAKAS
ncbi:MAG: diguanylate cyclase [Proteobacteria bacterium]|nr:diguanylate cyclase [Pseudomonadota bacterium]NIS68969.1 diguanylate cyclase [Pseudomonadota bacterium]